MNVITPTYILINIIVFAALVVGGFFVIRHLQKTGKIQGRKSGGPKENRNYSESFHRAGRKHRGNRVTGEKTSVIAIVAGITKNLRNPGEPETYYVVCNYKDPDSKLSTTFTSRELRKYPGKDIIGKPVRVRLDPDHPDQYTVDIDSIL